MEPEITIQTPKSPASTTASLIAGSFGGMAQVLVGQPLDTIKTRAQTARPGQFKGPLDIAMQTIRKEGFFALYKGMASPLIGVAGVNSLLFASNAYARKLVSPFPDLSIGQVALAGAMAGAAQSVLASPVEMFKYGANPKRLREVVGEMFAKYGWRKGIMRGYWITVVREIPAYAGFYAGYEWTKRTFQKKLGTDSLPVWATLTAGAMGGIAYWTAWYVSVSYKSYCDHPLTRNRFAATRSPPQGFNYIINTFKDIYRREGARAFVAGITPTYIRAVPAAASTFVAFELAMEFLQKNTSL
ncbi:SPOSA6832_00228, partial [Sporobolomyces salmonicolor]